MPGNEENPITQLEHRTKLSPRAFLTGGQQEEQDQQMTMLQKLEEKHTSKARKELQQEMQQKLNNAPRPDCPKCEKPMWRNHAYPRQLDTHLGRIKLQVPAFRCGECRKMASQARLLDEELPQGN